nr:hypothetical protein Iba_chr12aCG12070 [Ipomoea batatas]
MKKLNNSTIIGKKRKKIVENKVFTLGHNDLARTQYFNSAVRSPEMVTVVRPNSPNRIDLETGSAELTQLRVPFNDLTNGNYDGQCSLCPPTHTNSNRLRSNLSFDYCRNLEDEFAQTSETVSDFQCILVASYFLHTADYGPEPIALDPELAQGGNRHLRGLDPGSPEIPPHKESSLAT